MLACLRRLNIRTRNLYQNLPTERLQIKGETLDAALVVSSKTGQGGGRGYWLKWLKDPTTEKARFASVASSGPKYLLTWAIPSQSLNNANRKILQGLGFDYEAVII